MLARADSTNGFSALSMKSFTFIVPALVALLPLLQVWPLDSAFYVDWGNHVWLINYFGEFFRLHFWFPSTLVTQLSMGNPFPIFYGYLFYPLLAIPSAVLNPHFVVKAGAILLFIIQFVWIRKVFRVQKHRDWVANVLAIIALWAIYPLTNLYNRGAITEFFATGFLTCAVSAFFVMVDDEERDFGTNFFYTIFFLLLTVGTHPITAVYSVFIIALSLGVIGREKRHFLGAKLRVNRFLQCVMAAAFASMLPWFYATLKFTGKLENSRVNAYSGAFNDFDKWWVRFSPFPFDVRVLDKVPAQVSTPYLDAQVNLPLLVLALGILLWTIRQKNFPKWAVTACIMTYSFFTWLTISPTAMRFLPREMSIIDFVFRFITYQNLTCLIFLYLVFSYFRVSLREVTSKGVFTFISIFCLIWAGVNILIKQTHAHAVKTHRGGYHTLFRNRTAQEDAKIFAAGFYGDTDYAAAGLYEAFTERETAPYLDLWMEPAKGSRFGSVPNIELNVQQPTWVGTRVIALPWNKITVDGVAIPKSDLRTYSTNSGYLVFRLPVGKHLVTYRFEPDIVWSVLNVLAKICFFCMVGYSVYCLRPTFVRFRAHSKLNRVYATSEA